MKISNNPLDNWIKKQLRLMEPHITKQGYEVGYTCFVLGVWVGMATVALLGLLLRIIL
jgi:tetrahydromethanopterin S-methyltransferase subunit B